MYANRYAQPTRFNPGGLAAAVAVNAAFVAALIFSAPALVTIIKDKPLSTYPVEIDRPPPPEPQKRPPDRQPSIPTERIDVPTPLVKSIPAADLGEPTTLPPPPMGPTIGTDLGPTIADPPPPLPYVEASVDPRYAGALQPVYPASERRAGREGRVIIKVLIGVDGRVKQAEQVSASSDAFWQATFDRAMRTWRFRAATRGGIPVEAWRTMTLRFEITD